MCSPGGGDAAAHGIGGQVVDIDVTAARQNDRISGMALNVSRYEVSDGDAFGLAVNDHQVEHFGAGMNANFSGLDLAAEGLIGSEQQLLAGLAAGKKGAGNLGSTERAVLKVAGIIAGKGHSLGNALIDDVVADLGQTVDVGFAGPEVAAFDSVVEQSEDTVAVVRIVFGGVDPALGGDAVSPARTVLVAEGLHVVAEFGQGCRSRSAGKAGSDNEDGIFALVGRVDQFQVPAMVVPFICKRSGWTFAVEYHDKPPGSLSALTGPKRKLAVRGRVFENWRANSKAIWRNSRKNGPISS